MRGHPYCLSCSLRIHSIFRAVRLCLLGRLAPRPAPRAAVRIVMPPSRSPCVLLLVPSGVLLVSSSPAPPLSPPPLACFPWFPIVMAPRIASRPGFLSPRPSPRQSCRTSGETSPCLLLSCGEVLLRVASLPLSLMRGVSAFLALCRSYLKTSRGNLLKTFPGNLLKPFLGNPLKTAKHIPLSICPLSAFLRFASLRIAAYRLAVLSLVCVSS